MVLPEWENDVQLLEHAIAAKLVALGVDWQNEQALRQLSREIFQLHEEELQRSLYSRQLHDRLIAELAGLSQLMLRMMSRAAEEGSELHGGPVWKAFARALYQEGEALGVVAPSAPRSL